MLCALPDCALPDPPLLRRSARLRVALAGEVLRARGRLMRARGAQERQAFGLKVIINPVVTPKAGSPTAVFFEGCLSVQAR